MGRSEMKTPTFTSGGNFEVSMVKISARSGQVKGVVRGTIDRCARKTSFEKKAK